MCDKVKIIVEVKQLISQRDTENSFKKCIEAKLQSRKTPLVITIKDF